MIDIQTCHVQDIPMNEIFIFPYDMFGEGTSKSVLKPYNYAICVKRRCGHTYRVETIDFLRDSNKGYCLDPFRDDVIRTGVKYAVRDRNR